MDKIKLYEEFKLIERSDSQINVAWKGAHLLLFFLAFVFGSFCTFCFHMLMYLFDEKCVLFPKLLSLSTLRQNIIYEFMPYDKGEVDTVDFVSTQWVEKRACYLPTYVPLVSGISGLVWTTMFLMCSTGSRVFTGLQKSWRILPPVFIFSLAMGSVCIYTSVVTHDGLNVLCLQLSEITGKPSCTFTVNVATLAYERRIRGVYQAVALTILTAWLHTLCWLLSALLTVARVVFAVDFQLVRVSAYLKGNIDKMLESQEHQVGTVFPEYTLQTSSLNNTKVNFKENSQNTDTHISDGELLQSSSHYYGSRPSLLSSVSDERLRLNKKMAYGSVAEQHKFIVKILYRMLDKIPLPESPIVSRSLTETSKHSKMSINPQDDTQEVRQEDETKIIEGKKVASSEEKLSGTEDKKAKSNIKPSFVQSEGKDKKGQIESQTSVFSLESQKQSDEKKKESQGTQTHKEKQE